ncbi:Mut7-C RNAse domain-containing protein [Adhaeribacter radiodurans]|uniref:Mut7-C ubiquitin/RNAse domain-containing protein n=1 Tax=Adhaeribacter radiodurans TaxID=2745197 RepID=A0A7L7L693_9BACT|nr:Mut7-C RNAse domain-containing protein [Adhaeribacter radiodurans]QMU28025.1 Mut7-C ubiquitin/RNAse domain-containing protein [Adhaeribacter radiodurans]
MAKLAYFRFYGNLNDFLPSLQKEKEVKYSFTGTPAVKDAIEALGIPHPEVDIVLINGQPTQFTNLLQANDSVAVYPTGTNHVNLAAYSRQATLPVWHKFILDVHLGKLAKNLRLLGFDTLYRTDYDNKTIVQLAGAEERIILTRDVGLLKHKTVLWGYWLRSQHPEKQLTEVLAYFKFLPPFQPFTRCLVCNGILAWVPKETVLEQLPPKTKLYFQEFYQCQNCLRVLWKGSHYDRMQVFVQQLRQVD